MAWMASSSVVIQRTYSTGEGE